MMDGWIIQSLTILAAGWLAEMAARIVWIWSQLFLKIGNLYIWLNDIYIYYLVALCLYSERHRTRGLQMYGPSKTAVRLVLIDCVNWRGLVGSLETHLIICSYSSAGGGIWNRIAVLINDQLLTKSSHCLFWMPWQVNRPLHEHETLNH